MSYCPYGGWRPKTELAAACILLPIGTGESKSDGGCETNLACVATTHTDPN